MVQLAQENPVFVNEITHSAWLKMMFRDMQNMHAMANSLNRIEAEGSGTDAEASAKRQSGTSRLEEKPSDRFLL